jgi:hypothetical protein
MSDEIGELAMALASAQGQMTNAVLNKTNPHFKSKYADLASVRDATLPALSKNGLAIVQFTTASSDAVVLHTMLIHKSGQFLDSTYPVAGGTPQQMGSALTYARRYGWASMCGVAAEEDDDANAAMGKPSAAPAKSAYRARKDGDWPRIEKEMQAQDTAHALKAWGLANSEAIHALPDNWQLHFREQYAIRMTELTEGVGENGKATFKQRLKASVKAEDTTTAELIDDDIPTESERILGA